MHGVTLLTMSGMWEKLLSSNSTSASFGTLKSTLTAPSGDGVIDMLNGASPGAPVQNALLLRFFGAEASNEAFNARVWGWSQERSTLSWEAALLAQFAVTLGNLAGTASCAIVATDFEADTIALTYGASVDVAVNSPANDVRGAYARVDCQGFSKVQIEFDMNSSAASANCLYKRL
jgi:hypothetical protein